MGPPPLPSVVGTDGVGRLADGRRVYFDEAVAPFGSMAERALAKAEALFDVGDEIDDVTAAALGNTGLGAWLALDWRSDLRPGDTVLVLGAAGAVGTVAVQAAKLLGAGRVVAAGRAGERLERQLERGADAIVALDEEDDLAQRLPRRRPRRARRRDRHPVGPARARRRSRPPRRRCRHVQVGQLAGLDDHAPRPRAALGLARPARLLRRPPAARGQRREGFPALTRHVAAGDIVIDARARSRSPTSRPRGSARPRARAAPSSSWFLDRATGPWNGAGQPEGEEPELSEIEAGRPVVLRGGTVLTMNDAHDVLRDADVLVVGEEIAGGRARRSRCPRARSRSTRPDGIVMPGMVDTHRHMWQTALRGYGADWTLAQYFVFFYLEWGKVFRPQDIYAGNLLSALESLDAGVTTTVDWSHGLQTVDHADAAVDALQAVPGRFVLAYGNLQQGPWEWSTSKDFRAFVERRFGSKRRHARLPDGLRRHGRPRVPGEGGVRGRARARRAGHHPRRRVGRHQRRRHPAHARARLHDARDIYVHAATLEEDSYHRIAATGGSVSVSTESEQSAGQGYPPTWQLRKHDIPVSLSMDTSVWWSGDLFCAMRSTLGADRSREHLEAHAKQETVTNHHLRAEQVVDWATRGGSRALRHGRR